MFHTYFGCAQNLGVNSNGLAFITIQEMSGMSPTFTQTWFKDNSEQTNCIAVSAGALNAQFLV